MDAGSDADAVGNCSIMAPDKPVEKTFEMCILF